MTPQSMDAPSSQPQSAEVAAAKAIGFLGIYEVFHWAIYGPLRTPLQNALDPMVESLVSIRAGQWVALSLLTALAAIALTVVAVKVVERTGFASIGLASNGSGDSFGLGLFAGYLPGFVIGAVALAAGVASISSTRLLLLGFPLTFLSDMAFSLIAAGYAFQLLLRHFGPAVAIAVVTVAMPVSFIAAQIPKGLTVDDAAVVLNMAASAALLGFAFVRRANLWFAAGLAWGLSLAPTGYGLLTASLRMRTEAPRIWIQLGPEIVTDILAAGLVWAATRADRRSAIPTGQMPKGLYLGFWGCGAGTMLLMAILLEWRESRLLDAGGLTMLFTLLACMLVTAIVFIMFLYRMWNAINDGYASVSPSKAIGLFFIPLFNLYWLSQAIGGYTSDYNAYLDRQQLALPRMGKGPFITYVICSLASFIPFVGVLAMAVAYVAALVMIWRVSDGVNALPPQRNRIYRTVSGVVG